MERLHMGMSTYMVGFVPPDEQWEKYKKVWFACKEAGIEPPDDVYDYFKGEEPSENGMEISIKYSKVPEVKSALKEYRHDTREGYEVDLTKLPKNIKVLRFYNSW